MRYFMLNSRFSALKKPKPADILYHYDSCFRDGFSKLYTYFKTKWLINERLKAKASSILKQIENSLMLNAD